MEKVMVIANGEVLVDYAYPCMMAEKALKRLHDAMLRGDHEAAIEAGLEALAETKLTVNAVRDMKDRKL
jgi:hypothetical protein